MGRFFFHVSAFLLLLILRLVPHYWRAPFSLTWWATVFPLCLAATAWVTVASEMQAGAPFWVATTAVVAAATAAAACVAAATVVAAARGRLPGCDESVLAYARSRGGGGGWGFGGGETGEAAGQAEG